MKKKIGIDIGYGHTKVMFNNKVQKTDELGHQ